MDLVKAMRALAVDAGIHQPGWQEWNRLTDDRRHEPVGNGTPVDQARVADWAQGLDLPVGGETVLFCDCEAAFHRTSLPRSVARILQAGGVEFGLMGEQWCCGGPAAEMGYVEQARRFAEHNVADWRAIGAKRIIAIDPHDYIAFTEDYPAYFGDDFDFEIVLAVELVAEMVREGRLPLTVPIDRVVTYHDACRLNKRKGIHAAPREILRAIPGLTFKDVDHVTQWSYCSGAGGGPRHRAARPDRGDQPAQDGARGGPRRRHPGERLRLVGAPPDRGRRGARRADRRDGPDGAGRRVGRPRRGGRP